MDTWNKLIASSEDPTQLSLMIDGILMMSLPGVLVLAHIAGIPLADTVLTDWIKEISFGAALTIATYGFARRVKNNVWPSVRALFV